MGLLTRVNIHSLSGYAQHVCQLLGISHFNAGALVFCDGRTKHELTRDTESTLWFFRIPILLDFMMQSITLTGLTRLSHWHFFCGGWYYVNKTISVNDVQIYWAWTQWVEYSLCWYDWVCVCGTCHHQGGIFSGIALSFGMVIQYQCSWFPMI